MERAVLPLARRLGVRATLRLPFDATLPPLSFVHLAEAAGLGRRSILGVLIHPAFGPWIALRGALLVDELVAAARPAAGFEPCSGCRDRPCIAACPGAAVRHPDGWDVARCIDYRVADPAACADRCHARFECVYGRDHRYPAEALAYHQRRAFAVMAAARPAPR
jgi:epoxyqueuosine reductase QueG